MACTREKGAETGGKAKQVVSVEGRLCSALACFGSVNRCDGHETRAERQRVSLFRRGFWKCNLDGARPVAAHHVPPHAQAELALGRRATRAPMLSEATVVAARAFSCMRAACCPWPVAMACIWWMGSGREREREGAGNYLRLMRMARLQESSEQQRLLGGPAAH
jgi:hypothetical protein